MIGSSTLWELMQEPLPSIGYQRKLSYRTCTTEVIALYHLINATIFDNELTLPPIEVKARCRKYWGMCFGEIDKIRYRKTYCKIRLMDKFYCRQWLITVLAHEMCHQYAWDIYGNSRIEDGKYRIMTHGPSFFIFKDKLAEHGISLKVSQSTKKWFKHQNLFKY